MRRLCAYGGTSLIWNGPPLEVWVVLRCAFAAQMICFGFGGCGAKMPDHVRTRVVVV